MRGVSHASLPPHNRGVWTDESTQQPVGHYLQAWSFRAGSSLTVGLMDPICPPSTVYAAHHAYAPADKELTVWRYADHSGGAGAQSAKQLEWLADRGLGAD